MQGLITITNGQKLTLDGFTLAGKPHRSITALLREVRQIVRDNCHHEPRDPKSKAKTQLCKRCNQFVKL